MFNYKSKNIAAVLLAAFLIIALPFTLEQYALAGDAPTNTAESTGTAKSKSNIPTEVRQQERFLRELAAAQKRYETAPFIAGKQSNGDGGDGQRDSFSYGSSLMFLLLGCWSLIVLLLNKLKRQNLKKTARSSRGRKLLLSPSFALALLGFGFGAIIIGTVLTEPAKVSAKNTRFQSTANGVVANPANENVIKSALQISSADTVQIGKPVFDASGNLYVRGGFYDSVTIGETTLTASRDFDMFVAKFDATGTLMWARQATGATAADNIPQRTAIEGATALAVDAGGNVYVGGSFVKKISFATGANSSLTLTDAFPGGSNINYEPFVVKYDAGGNIVWAKGAGSFSPQNAANLMTGQNAIDQLVFDGTGKLYVTGSISGSKFLGADTGVAGKTDIVLANLDPATGNVNWVETVGGAADDNGLNLKVDGANNLYLIGSFDSSAITFPAAAPITITNNSAEEIPTDTFIAKFDASGDAVWVEQIGGDGGVSSYDLSVAGGSIYLTGEFRGTITIPTEPSPTVLTDTENGSGERDISGFITKLDTDGNFIWAKSFGGLSESLAVDEINGQIYLAGVFWDGSVFGAGEANQETVASFGGVDPFIARFDSNGNFIYAKPIGGSWIENQYSLNDPGSGGRNEYKSSSVAFNPTNGKIYLAGNFQQSISLDCTTLTTNGAIHSYVAELSADNEAVSCRIWNGLDADDNNWDSPDNWNGDMPPSAGESVYVPYTGNNFDAPDYNPANDTPLGSLSVADDRILTLGRNLTINERLDLPGGVIDAGNNFTVSLDFPAQTYSINDGRVIGKVEKQFFGLSDSFTFPVGTANGYSPVTLSNINSGKGGRFAVTAYQGTYPNTATNLPANRAARWWNLTNNGLAWADLTFKYLPDDITAGTESQYRAYRIPTGGGDATLVGGTINTIEKTVTVPNVSQFSDWTLAQLAPSAATVTVGGRVTTADNRAIAQARIAMTDAAGNVRIAVSNSFGYYRFGDVAAGETYVFNVSHKRFNFVLPTQAQNIVEERDDINFTAAP